MNELLKLRKRDMLNFYKLKKHKKHCYDKNVQNVAYQIGSGRNIETR